MGFENCHWQLRTEAFESHLKTARMWNLFLLGGSPILQGEGPRENPYIDKFSVILTTFCAPHPVSYVDAATGCMVHWSAYS